MAEKEALNQDIKKSIEDKSYFDDALLWYMNKFCSPVSERIFWGIILVFFIIFICFLQQQIIAWYPLKEKRPIIIYNSNTAMKQVVKKMSNSYTNADYTILYYLIKNYVMVRESFLKGSTNLLKIDQRLKKIVNNSTSEVARDYQRLFTLENTRNPIRRLGRLGIRKVEIVDIKLKIKEQSMFDKALNFYKIVELPRVAVVLYKATEKVGSREKQEYWQVNIGFNYSGVIIDKNSNDLMLENFMITDYQQKILKK